mgnify:FL=1
MTIQTIKESSATVVTISGRMDAMTAPEYEKTLNEFIASGETSFIVDFQGLDYISSAGLRALLATAKLLKTKGGQILLSNVQGTVREVFDISGFGTIFKIKDSVADALADLG